MNLAMQLGIGSDFSTIASTEDYTIVLSAIS